MDIEELGTRDRFWRIRPRLVFCRPWIGIIIIIMGLGPCVVAFGCIFIAGGLGPVIGKTLPKFQQDLIIYFDSIV